MIGAGTIKAPPLACFRVVNNMENANNWQGGGVISLKPVESFPNDIDIVHLTGK
jgi:hypothetical protein